MAVHNYSNAALTELDAVCGRFREHLFESAEIAADERGVDTVEVCDIPIRVLFDTRELTDDEKPEFQCPTP